ncbi:bifunctional DNA primase/polymerase [Amycolatopsis sp. EV170708-02-1]|uniref:bifunctional DNA primase/polymerase n=1 Tax=Amycolatopsis sp. EV170708-02-1 TaxID=2919322 RepID=UPI001F0C53F8|nr:bifunctional DNA primase/polymerase [Amycolatopsis sp. EV170708-02-1]UMP06821.1 hypothetical protein MJQ72_19315 [Amycolatopsis sp. EV170708-02-1]
MPSQGVAEAVAHSSQLEHMLATARAYRHFYGWPTSVNHTTGQVVLTVSDEVSAIVTRRELGEDALSLLAMRMIAGPVVSLPGANCAFLTGPACHLCDATTADLERLDVRLPDKGFLIPLPPSKSGDDAVRWLSGPKPTRPLPPWTAVIGALRTSAAMCPV